MKLRVLLVFGPIAAYAVTKRLCLALQRKDRIMLLHGRETGRIIWLPGDEYAEVHGPVHEFERWRLLSRSDDESLLDASCLRARGRLRGMTRGRKPRDPASARAAAATPGVHRDPDGRRVFRPAAGRPAPAALRIAAIGTVAALTLSLSGCDGYARDDVLALCAGFERSWNDLMQARSDTPRDEDILDAVQLAGERWTELSEQKGPDDLTDMLAIASSNLSGLRGAPNAQQRKVKVTSLRNSAGYIDLECGKAGAEITLAPLASLVAPKPGS